MQNTEITLNPIDLKSGTLRKAKTPTIPKTESICTVVKSRNFKANSSAPLFNAGEIITIPKTKTIAIPATISAAMILSIRIKFRFTKPKYNPKTANMANKNCLLYTLDLFIFFTHFNYFKNN